MNCFCNLPKTEFIYIYVIIIIIYVILLYLKGQVKFHFQLISQWFKSKNSNNLIS